MIRIALERAEVRRPIPRTSVQRVEEGRVDSKHIFTKDLTQHLGCTWLMRVAPCAEIPMLWKKVHGCQKSKTLSVPCTREFAVQLCA